MQFSVLNLMLCLVVAAGWIAVGGYWRLAARRRAREQAEWAAMEASLCDPDVELNLVWANEAGPRRPDR